MAKKKKKLPNFINPVTLENVEVIFVNHSGGKDSQAMLAMLIRLGYKGRIVIIHADLGEMEHEPMHGWIESISFGIEVHVVRAGVDFFELCRKRARFPGDGARFCTDTLKTQPCQKFMRQYMEKHGLSRGISALGIRAGESRDRAKRQPWKLFYEGLTAHTKNRFFAEWCPIFDYSLEQVWEEIRNAGQKPHRIYSEGWSRLSCVICVYGKKQELTMAKANRPELFAKMEQLEKELGKTIKTKQVKKQTVLVPLADFIAEPKANGSK